ncbi:hypothetical protein ACFLU1_03550 [Chloroflexota bacterium]
MAKEIKCTECDREFKEEEAMEYPGKVHVHKGKIICEDCLVGMGVMPDTADPYSLYIQTHSEPGDLG